MKISKVLAAYGFCTLLILSLASCFFPSDGTPIEPYVCITVDLEGVQIISFCGEHAMRADNSVITKGEKFYFEYPENLPQNEAEISVTYENGSTVSGYAFIPSANGENYELIISCDSEGLLQISTLID